MDAHEILIGLMGLFALLGAADQIAGNHLGLGREFAEGIAAMGALAMAMIGVITLAPVLAAVLEPVIVPVFALLGADGAMFAGMLLACDMGAGPLAMEMPAATKPPCWAALSPAPCWVQRWSLPCRWPWGFLPRRTAPP